MNLLIHTLPESLQVLGHEYRIRSSFRDCLRIMIAYEDDALVNIERQEILLKNIYKNRIPSDIEEALTQARWFLNGGTLEEKRTGGPRVYSFSKDAEMIFAAFRQVHHIDLTKEQLHWWQFVALFHAVVAHDDNAFGALVSLRYRLKTGKATPEERAIARSIPDLIDVPEIDMRTLEQKDAEETFFKLIAEGKQKRDQLRQEHNE